MASGLIPLGTSLDLGGGYRPPFRATRSIAAFSTATIPGWDWWLIGAIVLLTGLCISFYFLPARLYVKLSGGGRKWNVGIAATTVKGYEVFEDQFRDNRRPYAAPANDEEAKVMQLDHNLVSPSQSATYIVGALGLDRVFPLRSELIPHRDVPLAIVGCVAAVRRAGHALDDLRDVAAHQSLRIAFALLGDGRADFPHLRLSLRSLDRRRLRARDRGDRVGYATTWNEGYMPAGPRAAIVLDQNPRSARGLVVRCVHGLVRRLGAVFNQVVRRTTLRSGASINATPQLGRRDFGNDQSTTRPRGRGRDRQRRADRNAGDRRRRENGSVGSRSGSPDCRASQSST